MIHFGYIIFFQMDCNHQLAVELSGDGAVVPSPHVLALGDWHFQVDRVLPLLKKGYTVWACIIKYNMDILLDILSTVWNCIII